MCETENGLRISRNLQNIGAFLITLGVYMKVLYRVGANGGVELVRMAWISRHSQSET